MIDVPPPVVPGPSRSTAAGAARPWTELGELATVFASSGAMAELLAGTDWSATSLGPPETWPQSLRSAASICLGAEYPIAIYWGEDLSLLYNEAWSEIPGDRHPWALGRPAAEVWPDIWHLVGPEFERALAGSATWQADRLLPMERHGYLEETYFDYNLSPIVAEDGRIAGVFNAGIETTDRVLGDRRSALLLELVVETGRAGSVLEVERSASRVLGDHPELVAGFLLHRFDGGDAVLAGAGGFPLDARVPRLTLGDGEDPWALEAVRRTGDPVVVSDRAELLAAVETVGEWPEPPHTAVTVPVVRAGGRRRVAGALVVAIPAGQRLDEEGRDFLAMVGDRIASALLDAERDEEDRRAFEAEHRIASTLQRSLLPALPEVDGVHVRGTYLPGAEDVEVGGDWFDAVPGVDGSVTVVIGDVVGKGVAAAATMGQLRSAIRAYALEGFGPGAVLDRLNALTLTSGDGTFATVLCVRVDPATGTLAWCRGGHLPPLLRRWDGEVVVLDERGSPPVGVLPGASYVEHEGVLGPGDSLVLYTDGLVERRGEDIDVGIDRLVAELASLEDGDDLVDRLVEPVARTSRRDDVAALVLRVDR